MMKSIKHYPTATGGLCLGIVGIAVFWSVMISNKIFSESVLILGSVLAFSLLMPLVFKFICHPGVFLDDMRHPTVSSTIPTIAMTLMLLSRSLGLISHIGAIIVWCVAVAAHILFFTLFVYHRLRNFDLDHLVPTWFVPPVGIVVACLSVPSPFFLPLAMILLGFGIISYVILLPIVLYRIAVRGKIEDARKPTLAVLAAPASLTLAGYLTLLHHPNPLIVIFLFSLAILMTVTVYLILFHLLRLPFTPACTAFTFPLAIGATAMYKVSNWMDGQSLFQQSAVYFHSLAFLEGVIATIIIVYILQHIIRFILLQRTL